METTRQACPQCGATLELPTAAIGRKARCPSCQGTFVVAAASPPTAQPPHSSPPAAGETPTAATPSRSAPQGASAAGGGSPAAPPSKPGESFGGVGGEGFGMPIQRPSAAADNPYAVQSGMASAAAEPTKHGDLFVRTPSIDEIVSAATAIFTNRWQPLIIGGLIVFAYNILSGIAGQLVPAIAGAGGEAVLVVASVLMQFASSLIGFYLSCGLIRTALSVARGLPTPVSEMFPNPGVFGRVILTMLIPLLALFAIAAVVGGLGAAIYFATGQADEAGVGLTVIGVLLLGGIYLVMFFLLWPAVYIACDDRGSGMSALRTGFAVGISNKLNSFLFLLINMVLGLIGVLTCCIGQIATTPAVFLVAGVGYLMMTSQPISDPNHPNQGATPPGFGNPSYGSPGAGSGGFGSGGFGAGNQPYGTQG